VARFKLNRQWAFILALGASLVCCSFVSHDATAQTGGSVINDPGDPGYSPPIGGDPDSPSDPGASAKITAGRLTRNGSPSKDRTAGDGSSSRSAWLWRLRIVWLSLRGNFFRF
jgi:hypothetical protein